MTSYKHLYGPVKHKHKQAQASPCHTQCLCHLPHVGLAGVLPLLQTALEKSRVTANAAMLLLQRLLQNADREHTVSYLQLVSCRA